MPSFLHTQPASIYTMVRLSSHENGDARSHHIKTRTMCCIHAHAFTIITCKNFTQFIFMRGMSLTRVVRLLQFTRIAASRSTTHPSTHTYTQIDIDENTKTYSPIDSYLIGSRRKENIHSIILISFASGFIMITSRREHFSFFSSIYSPSLRTYFAFTVFGQRQVKPKVYFCALIDKSATSKRVPF